MSGAAETSLTDKVAQQAQSLAQQTQQKAGDLVDQAQDQVKAGLSSGKERAAGSLGAVAQALRQTSQQLRQQHQEGIAGFADTAAGQVERIAGYLRDRDIDQLAREAESLARSRPAMFLGGALALGFVAARFLKSSRANGNGATMSPAGPQSRPANYVPMYPSASSLDRPSASGAVTSHG
jgi:hypothetical protein